MMFFSTGIFTCVPKTWPNTCRSQLINGNIGCNISTTLEVSLLFQLIRYCSYSISHLTGVLMLSSTERGANQLQYLTKYSRGSWDVLESYWKSNILKKVSKPISHLTSKFDALKVGPTISTYHLWHKILYSTLLFYHSWMIEPSAKLCTLMENYNI